MALPIHHSRDARREDGWTDEILPGSLPPRPKAGQAIEPKTWKPGVYCGWEWLGLGKAFAVGISPQYPKGQAGWDGGGGGYRYEGTVEELCLHEGVVLAKWDEALASFLPGWTPPVAAPAPRPRIPVLGNGQAYKCATCGGVLGTSREAAELHDGYHRQTHCVEAVTI